MNLAAILLAAGGSSRMGLPKQLLPYQGEPLVRRAAGTALAGKFSPLIVVVGSEADAVADALHGLDVVICRNPDWQRGIGSSIRAGMARLPDAADGVLLLLADQPLLDVGHLESLRQAARPDGIAASAYAGTIGVPAIFRGSAMQALRGLPDDQGAKGIIVQHPLTSCVPWHNSFDVDSPADYQALEWEDEE